MKHHKKLEYDVAAAMGGKRTAMSGAALAENDAMDYTFSPEIKHTEQGKFSLTQSLWDKAKDRALKRDRVPAFIIYLDEIGCCAMRRKDFFALASQDQIARLSFREEESNAHGNYVLHKKHWLEYFERCWLDMRLPAITFGIGLDELILVPQSLVNDIAQAHAA